MAYPDRGFTTQPFTVALCTACDPELTDSVVREFRNVVRGCPHGVLIVTQCLLGELTCATRVFEGGVMLMLQPCTVDRVPVASAVWVGPLTTRADVDAAGRWVAGGSWDRQNLPLSLRADLNFARSSSQN
ncbi:MAG: hypothetical protein WBB00_25750 [Mycobacterium sp.]